MNNYRLPSIRELERNALNAPSIIHAWRRDTQAEIDDLESGSVSVSGMTRGKALRRARDRMKRIELLCEHFGCETF